jgi:signal transduction histidine kinase
MITNPFFNYRIFIWTLLVLAILMGGVFLVIAYTYKLQKETEKYIESARFTVNEGKEMQDELTTIKGLTYNYLDRKSNVWLDSLKRCQSRFIVHLERARHRANSNEEKLIIQQISGLYSNFEQNLNTAVLHHKNGDYSSANALLLYSAKDLIGTIQQKSVEFIALSKRAEILYEKELARTNSIILTILVYLGIGGIVIGLLFGWLLSRMLFGPLNQLVLSVRGASGEAVMEKIKFKPGRDIDELGERIKDLVNRMNKANEDLSRNKELLQHSNKYATLGKIAPTIAHEIRNPLASIKMLVYSIREETNISDSVKEDLDIISSEIERMENFTKDFLRFAKPADPVFSNENPMDSLQEVLKLLKPRFKSNSIQLIDNATHVDCRVLADSGQLKQIYMNLILNAIDVMPAGGSFTLDAQVLNNLESNGENSTDFVRINFSDSGPGIPEAIMKTLFEPFIKGTDMGVGIGLSISQSIANSHRGWITAENKSANGGAVFSLFLPLHY